MGVGQGQCWELAKLPRTFSTSRLDIQNPHLHQGHRSVQDAEMEGAMGMPVTSWAEEAAGPATQGRESQEHTKPPSACKGLTSLFTSLPPASPVHQSFKATDTPTYLQAYRAGRVEGPVQTMAPS